MDDAPEVEPPQPLSQPAESEQHLSSAGLSCRSSDSRRSSSSRSTNSRSSSSSSDHPSPPIPSQADVVILGAGPTGLVAALLLAKQQRESVHTLVFDLNAEPVANSRAHVLDPQSVAILEALGVPVSKKAHALNGVTLNVNGRDVVTAELGGFVSLPQSVLEASLLELLATTGVQVHRPVAGYRVDIATDANDPLFTSTESLAAPNEQAPQAPTVLTTGRTADLVERPCKVYLTLVDAYGNAVRCPTEAVQCRFVLGADGARSTVRRAIGVELAPTGPAAEYLVADVSVEWGAALAPHCVHIRQTQNGALTAIPLDGKDSWRVVCVRDGVTDPRLQPYSRLQGAIPDSNELLQILSVLVPGTKLLRVAWAAAFALEPALAPRLRKGSAVILGDAAHLLCPLFSPSLNLGIQDAMALSWRVAACIRGGAAKVLLDSFDVERRFAAQGAASKSTTLLQQYLKAKAASRAALALLSPLTLGNGLVARILSQLIFPSPAPLPVGDSAALTAGTLKCSAALQPGRPLPQVRVALPEKGVSKSLAELTLVPGGSYVVILILRVLPAGAKARTYFGCERKEAAMRWNAQSICAASRLLRLLREILQATASGVSVLWMLSGMTPSPPSSSNLPTKGESAVPPQLLQVFAHIGASTGLDFGVCLDYENKISCDLKMAEPYHGDGNKKSCCFLLVRPDGMIAANGYAGDTAAMGGALELVTRLQQA